MAEATRIPVKTSKDKGHKTIYFPEIPPKEDLKVILTTRLGQRDILPTRIVERLLSAGAVVAHALSGSSHTGTLSDAQHGARGTIDNAHAAANITNTAAGSISATNVQAAINELDTEKSATSHTHTYLPLAGGTMDDGANIALNTTTGTKIGTATTQKLGFWNKAPTTQPTAMTTQLTTITHTEPGTPDYAIQNLTQTTPYGFVTADEGNSVLKVIANLQTRVAELETKLQAIGLIA